MQMSPHFNLICGLSTILISCELQVVWSFVQVKTVRESVSVRVYSIYHYHFFASSYKYLSFISSVSRGRRFLSWFLDFQQQCFLLVANYKFWWLVQICPVMGLKLYTRLLYITLLILDKQLQILVDWLHGQAHLHTTYTFHTTYGRL